MNNLDFLTLDSWITSDNHWGHENIRKYGCRPQGHFEFMRKRWIQNVQPDDVLLHLGDIVCFGDQTKHLEWIEGLPGDKYLIRGNHDKHPDEWYEQAGFTVLGRGTKPFYWVDPRNGDLIAFSHEPLGGYTGEGWFPFTWNIHGHIHINPLWDEYDRQEQRINVCVEVTNYAPIRLRDLIDKSVDN